MLKVGLTGGIGSGKSFVGDALAGWGCFVVHADEIGHKVLAPGGEACAEVVREFGPEILAGDGAIDRQLLAARVFGHPEALERLNRIVHPLVIGIEQRLLQDFAAREPHGIGVVEAAILIETGSYKRFDRMILVFCRPEQQLERAMRRPGAVLSDIQARIARQMPLDRKRKFVDFVIDTSGEKDETLRQARAVYQKLRRIEL